MRCEYCRSPLNGGFCLNPYCTMGIYSPVGVPTDIPDTDIRESDLFDETEDDYDD